MILHADRWDSLIEYWATVQDMPWLLIKAVCRQESGMNPLAVSPCGAQGLMQLMPDTAKGLGISNSFDPDSNLRGGISYLKDQYKHFPEIINPDDRWDFALAAYNAGRGNINRAMAACKARREAWQQWYAVSIALPEITDEENAKQTTGYVANIRRYWSEYQSLPVG